MNPNIPDLPFIPAEQHHNVERWFTSTAGRFSITFCLDTKTGAVYTHGGKWTAWSPVELKEFVGLIESTGTKITRDPNYQRWHAAVSRSIEEEIAATAG